jgi:hypothetical protein
VEATRTLAVGDVNADELRQDFTQLEASDWKFADGAARQTLERFSRGLCVGRRAQKLGQDKALEPLVGELLSKLYSRTWSSTEQLSGINQPFIDHPPQAGQGCCVVGTIFGRPTQSGATILLIKLLGSDKMIAGISLPGETLAAGDKPVLLFGIASQNSIPYATPADGRIDIPVLEMAVCATLGKVQEEKKSAE